MASSKLFIILAIVATFFPSILAMDYVVGDGEGWKLGFDYQKWAAGKEFHVGDNLIFTYKSDTHNVIKIADKASFDQCARPADAKPLTSGNDTIPLKTTGKKWYICGASGHCDGGQKLAITVLAEGPATSPPPSDNSPPKSAATGRTASVYYGLMAVMVAFVGGIVMV